MSDYTEELKKLQERILKACGRGDLSGLKTELDLLETLFLDSQGILRELSLQEIDFHNGPQEADLLSYWKNTVVRAGNIIMGCNFPSLKQAWLDFLEQVAKDTYENQNTTNKLHGL